MLDAMNGAIQDPKSENPSDDSMFLFYLFLLFLISRRNMNSLLSFSITQHRTTLALNYYKLLHKTMIKLKPPILIVKTIRSSNKSDYSCSQ